MVQWMNLQRINRFVNPTLLYISFEKSGGLHIAELGLTAGRLAGWQAGSPADKIWVESENFKACCRSKYLIFCFV